MTSERWAEVDKLLDEALAREPDERAAFLDQACSDDTALRREVESLLAAHRKAEEKFLKVPAIELAAQSIAARSQHSLIGQTFSHYSVISILGVGGMGEVYLARDTSLNRKVALKFLPPQYTQDAARIRRFEREARAASALNHPNILTIYEIGEIADKHFIASEYIDGQTLRELLLNGRLAMKDAIEIVLQIASALAAAHEAGIVHRDIKPENVMLRRDGYAKVLDFGLVKLTERRHSEAAVASSATNASEGDIAMTNPGAVLGTIRYMSPEQAMGQDVDARSDLFSLGVLLYELVTGVLPFKGHSTAATLDAIAHHQHVPVTQVRPDLHSELERIISRALEKDRELRHQTASDLRADLKRLARELDSLSHAVSSTESRASTQAKPAPPKWKRKALLSAAVLALIVAAMTVSWWFLEGGSKVVSPWEGADQTQITDFPGEELFPSLSPDGKTIVYARRSREGNFDLWSQRVGGINTQNLTGDCRDHDTQPAFSPDGKLIAFRSERAGGGIFVMGASGESARRLTDSAAYHPAWSPDGKEIIYTEEQISDPRSRTLTPRRLRAVVMETGQQRIIKEHDIAQPAWSPNGYRIAYWGQHRDAQRDIWTIPAQGGESAAASQVAVTDDVWNDWNPVWAPDGKYLYFASDRTRVMNLWRVPIDERTGKTLGKPELVPSPSGFSQHISFSKDGKQLAFVDLRPRFRLASVAFDTLWPGREVVTAREDFVITETSWQTYYPDVSPDGMWLVYNATVGNREDLYLVKTDGTTQPQKLTDDDDKDRYPRWSPDGNRIAFFSNRAGSNRAGSNRDQRSWQIWTINRDGSGRQQVTAVDDGEAFFPNWSPSGDRLAYTLRLPPPSGTALFVVDLAQTLPARGQQLPYDPQIRFWPRDWSADGKRIIGSWRANVRAPELTKAYSLETNQFQNISDFSGERQAWFAQGRRLLYLFDGKLFVADAQTGKNRELLARPPYRITWFTLPRDGRTIYFAQDISEANVWVLSQK